MPLTEKKKASNAKWDAANLKRLSLAVRADLYEKMSDRIAKTGETRNGYINRLIENDVKSDDRQK